MYFFTGAQRDRSRGARKLSGHRTEKVDKTKRNICISFIRNTNSTYVKQSRLMFHEYSRAFLHVVHYLIYQLCADGQGPQPWSPLLTFSHGKSPPMPARACGIIPPICGNLPRRKYGILFSPADTTVGSSTRTGRRKAAGERARQRAGFHYPRHPFCGNAENAVFFTLIFVDFYQELYNDIPKYENIRTHQQK